jgi:hypothetical protein
MFVYRAGDIKIPEGKWFVLTPSESVGKYKFNDKLNQELISVSDKIWNILKEY